MNDKWQFFILIKKYKKIKFKFYWLTSDNVRYYYLTFGEMISRPHTPTNVLPAEFSLIGPFLYHDKRHFGHG